MASTPTAPGGPPVGSTNLGIAPNIGGLLCYVPCCIGLVFSVVVAVVEKQSRFLRFHAFQSLLVHAAALVVLLGCWFLSTVFAIVHIGFLSLLIIPVQFALGLAVLGVEIFLMIKAYNNEEYELPRLGQMARQWA
jgi:uncharacterized membrane protein